MSDLDSGSGVPGDSAPQGCPDPAHVRDMLVACCARAHGEMNRATVPLVSEDARIAHLYNTAHEAVRLEFISLGANWENPSADDLAAVFDSLVDQAHAWGAAQESLEHHIGEMRLVIASLTDCARPDACG